MKKIIFVIAATLITMLFVGCDDYNAPAVTRSNFETQYPSAVDIEWERKRGYAVAEFHIPGQGECEAWYTKSGEWVMTRFDIKYNELPGPVRTAFETEYGIETPVDDVERLERNNKPTIYFIEATVVVNGYLTDIYLDYAEDGTLLRTTVDIDDYDGIYYYI
ncbi:MAG: PepSY-like domain-containing protein [Alistipes sp.]|nr:PepSY-like domain-containing protein [Alistipes sp.]